LGLSGFLKGIWVIFQQAGYNRFLVLKFK